MNTKRFFPILLFAVVGLFIPLSGKDVETSFEESLQLRRIAEYWKEKDYSTAKIQIREFLNKNPKSTFIDQLYAMLGDLYFQEKNFKEAADSYDKIEGKQFRQKCQFHRLHSLYEIGKHEEFILSSDLFLKDPNAKTEELNTIRFELAESYFLKAHAPENAKKKKELLKAALTEYQQLMQTKFSDLTLLPQAQIYACFEEHSKAASLYLLLANKDANKKEEYLFQAASLQLSDDKKAAIETFGAISEMNGKYASKAAFNQLNLLYQEKRYRDFILAQDKALKHISQDKLSLIQYYLGKSLFHVGDFVKAIDPLSQSLAGKNLDRAQEKSALLTLTACAKETQDFALFEKILSHLKSAFANDEETTHVLLMHMQWCRDKNEWGKARADIKELLEISTHHPQREALLYDNALLLSQEGKRQEAATAFETFIKEFPQSANKMSALRHSISNRMEDVKHASQESERVKKEQLLIALTQALEENKIFSPTEKQKIRYLQGKMYFELDQHDEAIVTLGEYIRDFPKDPSCADAYLLLSYSYQKGSRDEIHFALNAEKALAFNPQLQGNQDLHLTLFNTYLSLAGTVSADEKAEMIEKAADHLFLALDKPINNENQRWLAGYYSQRYQNGQSTFLERTAIVLEKLLNISNQSLALSISPETLDREGEAIKLADVYAKTGRLKDRAKLLEALIKQYHTHPDYQWKYQRMASFELGKTYLSLDENERALQTFDELISSSSHISSYFAIAAQLEKAKLKYLMLKEVDRLEDSKEVLMICDALKDVQSKRKLHSEPLHLEAAFHYVEIKSDLARPDQMNNRKRFLLQQMKENFSSKEDPLVKDYLSSAAQFPEKNRLYQQYLAFIDAEMLRLEGLENHDAVLLKQAQAKLDELLKEASEEPLTQRIHQSKNALEQAL